MSDKRAGSGLPPAKIEFPTWMKVRFGGMTKEELARKLRAEKFLVGPWARGVMSKDDFVTSPDIRTVELVKAQVRDLGFRNEPWTQHLFARIGELGYDLCPVELGPHLRLQLLDQPEATYFWVAMPTIVDTAPRIFFLGRSVDGTRWLRGYAAAHDFRWVPDAEFVFARRPA